MLLNARAAASQAIARVLRGASLDDALSESTGAARDRALVAAIAYGVLRELRLLRALLARLLHRLLSPSDRELEALLLAGLFQLRSMRMAPHAAVSETVSAAAALGRSEARKLVNATLRRYLREREALEAALPKSPGVRLSYPDWLVRAARRDWPGNWETVLTEGNRQGPLVLRVNHARLSRAAYLAELAESGIAASAVEHAPDAVQLATPLPVDRIPGFAEGRVSVQDAAAQLAAALLEPKPGLRVLDACAAPGGKSAHLLERCPGIALTALDVDSGRLARVGDNLRRLALSATLAAGDAAAPQTWWDGQAYDRILLDAPCSGTGVIRRHPDIKWLRRESDIAKMAALQSRLLEALWDLLAPGGVLVYATCSILDAEGVQVVLKFLARHPEAKCPPLAAPWGEPCRAGRRLAPGGAFDGFHYARLRKGDVS